MAITLADIAKKLEDNLKKAIKDARHVDSGHLINSIKVSFKKDSNELHIEAAEYIKFLDDGKFLKDILSKEIKKIKKDLAKYYKEEITRDILKN